MPQFRHHVKKVAVKPEPKVYWGSVDGSGGSWHSQPPAQTDWNKDGLDGLYKDGHGGALFCQSWSKPEEAPKRDPFLGYQEGWGAGKKAEKKMEGKSASHCDDPWAGVSFVLPAHTTRTALRPRRKSCRIMLLQLFGA